MSKTECCRVALWAVLTVATVPWAVPSVGRAQADASASTHVDTAALARRAAAQSAATMQALHRARQHHDPMARCFDSTLAQLNSTRREIDERVDRFERAQAAGKQTEVEHQALVLRYLERRLERLDPARACQPAAEAVKPGETRVHMLVLGPVPKDEPAAL